MHADVAEVSKEYLNDVGIMRNAPRELLSATESVAPRWSPGALLHAFLKLPFFPSQVPDDVAPISGVCALRRTASSTAF